MDFAAVAPVGANAAAPADSDAPPRREAVLRARARSLSDDGSSSSGCYSDDDDGDDDDSIDVPDGAVQEETVCAVCQLNHGASEIIMCDSCDREYHGACVGALTVPTGTFESYAGTWVCPLCMMIGFMPVPGEVLGT